MHSGHTGSSDNLAHATDGYHHAVDSPAAHIGSDMNHVFSYDNYYDHSLDHSSGDIFDAVADSLRDSIHCVLSLFGLD